MDGGKSVRCLGVVGVLVSLAMVSCAKSKPPPPAGDRILVLSYNVRGVLRNADNAPVDPDRIRFIHVLADRIADRKPDVVLLQEVCAAQAGELERLLAGRHAMTLTMVEDSDQDRCAGPVRRAGKAMLVAGGTTSPFDPPPYAPSKKQGCVHWHRPPDIDVCVIHVSGEEARRVAPAFQGWKVPLILGGDFNARPHELLALYSTRTHQANRPAGGYMFEAGMCRNADCSNRAVGGKATFNHQTWLDPKIDYIFVSDTHFQPWAHADVEDTDDKCGGRDCSDHRMLWGEFRLLPSAGAAPSGTAPPGGLPPELAFLVGEWGGRGRQLSVRPDGTATLSLRGLKCDHPAVVAGEPCEAPAQIGGAETVLELSLAPAGDRIVGRINRSNNPRVPAGGEVVFRRLAPGQIEYEPLPISSPGGAHNLCNSEAVDPTTHPCG